MLISINIKGKTGQKGGKIGTYLFGQHPYKTNVFQGGEPRGHRGGTPKSGDLAGVAGRAPNNRQSGQRRGNVRFQDA